MTTATQSKATTQQPKKFTLTPALTTTEQREKFFRDSLVGVECLEGKSYTEADVNELLNFPQMQELMEIDGAHIQKLSQSLGIDEAIKDEVRQFRLKHAFAVSALTSGRMGPLQGLRTHPWTLAVTQVRWVKGEMGQRITVSTELGACLWTKVEDHAGKTKELRSTFNCSMADFEKAESIGFFGTPSDPDYFNQVQVFPKPMLIKGYPEVLPNGEPSFKITEFCLDVGEAAAMKREKVAKERALAAEVKAKIKAEKQKAVAEKKAQQEAAKQAKAEERQRISAEKKALKAAKQTQKPATKVARRRGTVIKRSEKTEGTK